MKRPKVYTFFDETGGVSGPKGTIAGVTSYFCAVEAVFATWIGFKLGSPSRIS
jgi:hypothetical protein